MPKKKTPSHDLKESFQDLISQPYRELMEEAGRGLNQAFRKHYTDQLDPTLKQSLPPPGRIHGFCTAIDAAIRGIPHPPREKRSVPPPDEPIASHEDIVHGEPPTKGPLIHLPARARKAFHQHGIKTLKQLRARIASGELTHTTYPNYGRTTHKAVLKALGIQPTCPHCGQTLPTK